MRVDVITIFPEWIDTLASYGVVGRAIQKGLLDLHTWNPREFTTDVHRTVDDRPYGGGPGMLMKVEPLRKTMDAVRSDSSDQVKAIYLSPQGRRLSQPDVQRLAEEPALILVAGRYEGVDERFIESDIDEEWSVGDYVLSGGEPAAMVMIDAICRLQPGVLGHEDSAQQDSFSDGLLDCPHYTRPERIGDQYVPKVLLGGDHAQIARWRLKQALGRTWQRRPDLLEQRQLSQDEEQLLQEVITEYEQSKN